MNLWVLPLGMGVLIFLDVMIRVFTKRKYYDWDNLTVLYGIVALILSFVSLYGAITH